MAESRFEFLNDGGEMGALMRAYDWSSSTFGPLRGWPQSLRSMVAACLNSPLLGTVLWGPDMRMLYNDAYIPSMADLHPGALGRPVREVWGDTWSAVAPYFEKVWSTGRGFIVEGVPLRVKRREVAETTYWDFTATPIRGEDGSIVGLLNQGMETTTQVLSRRRERFMSDLAERLRDLSDPRQAMNVAATSLGQFLRADRAGYAEIEADDAHFTIDSDWTSNGMPSLAGRGRLNDFGPLQIDAFRTGHVVAVADASSDEKTQGGTVLATMAKAHIRATLTVPLVKHERFVSALYVHCREPRSWSAEDIAVCREVAERTWAAVERARAESDLQKSEARFQAAFKAAPFIGTWDWELSTDQVFADERFAKLYSVDPALAARGAPLSVFMAGIHADDREQTTAQIQEALKTGNEFRSEYRLQTDGGGVRWVLAQGRVQFDSKGDASSFSGVSIDITDNKLLENRQSALIDFTDRTRNISIEGDIAFIASEVIGRTLGVSRAGYGVVDLPSETITIDRGWCAAGMTPLAPLLHFRDYGTYIEDLKRGQTVAIADVDKDPRSADFAQSLKSIEAYAFVNMPVTEHDETVALLYVTQDCAREWSAEDLAFLSDIAERTRIATGRARAESELRHLNANLEARVALRTEELERAQDALRQSQKMEAVGQLTGGLAHDFNNLLTGITGSLELLNVRVQQGRVAEIDRYVHAAQGAAKRAAALTHRLLAFSRRQTLDPKATDVNRLVIGMNELLQRTIGPAVALESVAASGLWTTIIDPGQLENALLNLCINARDAMPQGGKLTIETGNKWLDERAARARDVAPGQYVTVCVSDTGTGMPPDVLARAFDPFFTTKPIGMGTGLGLSMVYGFARQSGGQVRIYSEIGKGTMVCLYFPRHMGSAAETEVEFASTGVIPAEHSESVLVVDDEPTVRMLVVEVLQDMGCVALEAHDATTGMKILSSGTKIDLLITDVGLPGGMNGRQLADAARQVRPNLEVLFITGYAENALLSHGHLEPGMHVLTKPFTIEDLVRRAKELIRGRSKAFSLG